MAKLIKIVLSTLLFVNVYASPPVVCQPLSDEAKNFNVNDFNHCMASVDQCPKTGPFYENNCVTKATEQNPSCKSVSAIAKAVNVPITQLSFSPIMGTYHVVTVTYPADGQVQNYILSPKGCLVDTIVDPRKLSLDLKQQYTNKEWVVVNTELPVVKKHADGSASFSVLLRVTEDCSACAIIGWADVIFTFDTQGDLVNSSLKFFGPEPIGLNTKNSFNHS